jgi:hypothetical protein
MTSSNSGHRLSASFIDPFSDPEEYYGDAIASQREQKDHRRAFSTVSISLAKVSIGYLAVEEHKLF